MSWSIGFDENWKRDIGYGVPAVCDLPGCKTKIDRGLSYVCGGDICGGSTGCGLFFCPKHLHFPQLCRKCFRGEGDAYKPKPDTKEWINFKMTDPSWAEWRKQLKVKKS